MFLAGERVHRGHSLLSEFQTSVVTMWSVFGFDATVRVNAPAARSTIPSEYRGLIHIMRTPPAALHNVGLLG